MDSTLVRLRRLLGRIAGPDIDLVIECERDLPPARFDHAAFRLVVVELVRVASETIVDRGRIAVRAAAQPESIELTVADSGPGFVPDDLPSPFEPFHARTGRGASAEAGLAAVHGIIELNGGRIGVVATPGGGSKFSIYLPRWA